MSTLKVSTLQNASSATPNITLDASGNATVGGGLTVTNTVAMGSSFLRNRIINGDMRVDQRATAVSGAPAAFTVDRWQVDKSDDATESFAQNSDAPSGFSYSLRDTISVGDATIGAAQYSQIQQKIEGFNIADLAFGTSSARSVTLSFWVRSTVTGQYTANIRNSDNSRICPFNYTILASNTWEYKSVTLPGCPDGTWNSTNGVGIVLSFYPAIGSNYLGGTAGVWNNSTQFGSGSPVNGIASNGNIFAITGVQLEVGSVATPFERRQYGQELMLCQRYYQRYSYPPLRGFSGSNAVGRIGMSLPVVMRTAPAASIITSLGVYDGLNVGTITAFTNEYNTVSTVEFDATLATGTFTAGAGRAAGVYNNAGAGALALSSEL